MTPNPPSQFSKLSKSAQYGMSKLSLQAKSAPTGGFYALSEAKAAELNDQGGRDPISLEPRT